MIYLYLFGTCFHFIYVFMIIGKYRDHRYGAVRSLDHGETWEDVSDQVSFPKGIRHGTAFAVDASVILDMIQ